MRLFLFQSWTNFLKLAKRLSQFGCNAFFSQKISKNKKLTEVFKLFCTNATKTSQKKTGMKYF